MKNDGGPAFPMGDNPLLERGRGMTLRDFFAAHLAHGQLGSASQNTLQISYEEVARNAYGIADAMLAERIK